MMRGVKYVGKDNVLGDDDEEEDGDEEQSRVAFSLLKVFNASTSKIKGLKCM